MLNFLPQKNKKQIVSEYLLRITIFLMFFIFASSLVTISLFIPSFFFTRLKNSTISDQLESIKQKNMNMGEDPIISIKKTNKLLIIFSDNNISNITYIDIINKIVSLKNKNIKILSVSIMEENTTKNKKILISGIADTRDNLSLFEKNIRTDGFFNNVSFPLADFIKSSDSEFSATLTL